MTIYRLSLKAGRFCTVNDWLHKWVLHKGTTGITPMNAMWPFYVPHTTHHAESNMPSLLWRQILCADPSPRGLRLLNHRLASLISSGAYIIEGQLGGVRGVDSH